MKVEIKVPAMGESISDATIGTILKPSGSTVNADDEILELETDKVNQAIYAPQAGTLSLNISSGEVVKIGQVIGYVDSDKTPEAAKENERKKEGRSAATPPPPPPALEPPPKTSAAGARRTKEAFLEELTAKEPLEPPPIIKPRPTETTAEHKQDAVTRKKMSRVRRIIAERLVEAQRTTAMLTTFNEADMSQIIALRDKYKDSFAKQYGVKLGFMSFFVKAVVAALGQFPNLNSYIEGEDLVHREYYDIGIAVGTDKGLFVPVIRGCNRLTFAQIESQLEQYAAKAREGTITVDDLKGGGFTITNGGVYGSLLSTPILNPPQCGILGMHKIIKRPIAINDQVAIRPMMYLALSYDHRIVDGKEAVSFLVLIKNLLEDPARLLLDI